MDLHKLMHSILANSGTREAALNYLGEVLCRNVKRQQMHVDERIVAGDGFMINFVSVMQVGFPPIVTFPNPINAIHDVIAFPV